MLFLSHLSDDITKLENKCTVAILSMSNQVIEGWDQCIKTMSVVEFLSRTIYVFPNNLLITMFAFFSGKLDHGDTWLILSKLLESSLEERLLVGCMRKHTCLLCWRTQTCVPSMPTTDGHLASLKDLQREGLGSLLQLGC